MKLYWKDQRFLEKHGEADSQSARLYLREFKKYHITAKDFAYIAENLGLLAKPEYIAHVSELINLVIQRNKQKCRLQLGIVSNVKPLTATQTDTLRQASAQMRQEELDKMRSIINKARLLSQQNRTDNPVSQEQ